jgi:monoamine oxidase
MGTFETGVVIVGAGAAGLSAARQLTDLGIPHVVFEAQNRTGGRAFTDTETFGGLPFDYGCHWLHCGSINPFRAIADTMDRRYLTFTTRKARAIHLGDRWATEAERDAAWNAVFDALDTTAAGGWDGPDVAASDRVTWTPPWERLQRHWLTLNSAVPPEEISTRELAAYTDTNENYPVEDGYGALVQAYATGLPVTKSCPVTAIDWSGQGVAVETPRGTIRARAAIVTVSTAVMTSGRLRVTPDLPAAHTEAFAALPAGHAEKVAFRFDRDVFGLPPTSYIDTLDLRDPDRRPINFQISPWGRPLAIGQVPGPTARDLKAQGDASMIEFGLAALADAFGNDIRRRVVTATATDWIGNRYIAGGYSCALPGKAHLRRTLVEPVADRVFFAGEAVSWDAFSTCHGAHLTGLDQARRVAALHFGTLAA